MYGRCDARIVSTISHLIGRDRVLLAEQNRTELYLHSGKALVWSV